jgi:Zn-dependent protease
MHWLLLILIAGQIIRGWSQSGTWGLEWTSVTMLILLLSILFHELAHCWVGVRLGGHAEGILLWPLGGVATIEHEGRPKDQLQISAIGPISSFVFASLCVGALLATGVSWSWTYLNPWDSWWPSQLGVDASELLYHVRGFLVHAVRLNLLLALFNLVIPAFPLDGAKVLFSFLTIRYDRERAASILIGTSFPIGLAMTFWGIAKQELNILLVGIWVLYEAFQMRRFLRMGELNAHPAFASRTQEYEYLERPYRPERAKEQKPGWFARWRQKRALAASSRAAERELADRARVDQVLEKVSREGIGSLTSEERRILDQASRRNRGED